METEITLDEIVERVEADYRRRYMGEPDSVIEKVCITIPRHRIEAMTNEQLFDMVDAFIELYLPNRFHYWRENNNEIVGCISKREDERDGAWLPKTAGRYGVPPYAGNSI